MTWPTSLRPLHNRWAALSSALQPVLLPFLLSRMLVLLIVSLDQLHRLGSLDLESAALIWDGSWFADIALKGYGFRHADTNQTPLPFFPLFPLLLQGCHRLGLPIGISGAVINQLGLLVGLCCVWQLGQGRLRPASLRWALWLMAFFPGSAAFSLCYSDGLFLAFSTAALYSQGQHRLRLAGGLAAAAAITRPNGLITAIALTSEGLFRRVPRRQLAWLLLPAVTFVLLWSLRIWQLTGQPLAWIEAKQAWQEIPLSLALVHPSSFPWVDGALALGFLGLCLLHWRRWPLSWSLFGLLCVLPSLLTGLTGMPRYLVSCFPAFLSLSVLLEGRRWWALGLLSLSGLKLASATLNIVSLHRTP